MFTLHTVHNTLYYYKPLIFALLPNKTVDTYKNMYKVIIKKFNELGFIFISNKPSIILLLKCFLYVK